MTQPAAVDTRERVEQVIPPLAPEPQLPATAHTAPQSEGVVWTDDQIALLKRTVARETTDDELKLFLHICTRTGLDPFAREIYAIKRWDRREQRKVMTVQTGIDGYRVTAERTGRYSPGKEPTYTYKPDRTILSATAYIEKLTDDGTWHTVAATAFWDEYVQLDNNTGKPTKFWKSMPHNQIAKCAEALALRKAFPRRLANLYTFDEMGQAQNDGGSKGADIERPAIATPERKNAIAAAAAEVVTEGYAHEPSPEDAAQLEGAIERMSTDPAEPDEILGEREPADADTRTLTLSEIGSLIGLVKASKRTEAAFKAYVEGRFRVTSRKSIQIGWLPEIQEWLAAGG